MGCHQNATYYIEYKGNVYKQLHDGWTLMDHYNELDEYVKTLQRVKRIPDRAIARYRIEDNFLVCYVKFNSKWFKRVTVNLTTGEKVMCKLEQLTKGDE